MKNKDLFNADWAQIEHPDDSWAKDVLNESNKNGSVYLATLSEWFRKFPGSTKQKNQMKASLLHSDNSAHLGAVNELSWWVFLKSRGYCLEPIPTGKNPTPDFEMITEKEKIIFEVTTLNPSRNIDTSNLKTSQSSSSKRIINKVLYEKKQQIEFGFNKSLPVVIVLFNYDEWSGFGTQFNKFLEFHLSTHELPVELSAIIYLERFVTEGKSEYKKGTSFVFYNPSAQVKACKTFFDHLFSTKENSLLCEKA